MEIESVVAITVGVTGLFSAVTTKLWDAYHMEKKYRTNADARTSWEEQRNKEAACMKKREVAEHDIREELGVISRQLVLGNLIMGELGKKNGLSEDIERWKDALGLNHQERMPTSKLEP